MGTWHHPATPSGRAPSLHPEPRPHFGVKKPQIDDISPPFPPRGEVAQREDASTVLCGLILELSNLK